MLKPGKFSLVESRGCDFERATAARKRVNCSISNFNLTEQKWNDQYSEWTDLLMMILALVLFWSVGALW